MAVKRVILEIGHIYKTKFGAYNSKLNLKENNVCNDVIYEIMKRFHREDLDVIVKRRTTLAKIPQEINELYNEGTVVVYLHLNAFNSDAQGEEILYTSDNGLELAKKLFGSSQMHKTETMKDRPNFGFRGFKFRDDLAMLTQTKPVAILYEPFFLDAVKTMKEYIELREGFIQTMVQFLNNL